MESLEDRITPTFNALFDGVTWTLTQVQDNGNVTITVDSALNLTVSENAGSTTNYRQITSNLRINMLPTSTSNLDVTLDGQLPGNLDVNLGLSGRNLSLDGTVNFIFGNLRITGGLGDQFVELSDNALLTVGGSLFVDLGSGNDVIDTDNGFTVGSDVTFFGVNRLFNTDSEIITVGGNLTFNASFEAQQNTITFRGSPTGPDSVGGNLTYFGNSGTDDIDFENTIVGGNFFVDLKSNLIQEELETEDGVMLGFEPQEVRFEDSTIGGNLIVLSGLSEATQAPFGDFVSSDSATLLAGNISSA
ncbi:MAG: hypothetical protein ACFCD0_11510 [Gemmataceae bacterium]